jgi:putative sigma-54 modulation protein
MHDQVVSKMQRLDRYLDRLQTIDVELCKERTRAIEHQNQVEVSARVPGRTIRVATNNADMLAAVDEAVDKLYRQLNRKKERMKDHHGVKPAEILPPTAEVDVEVDDDIETAGGTTLHVETVEVTPLFEDEAIDEMDALGRPFLVFLNARNERINVLYRRDDGTIALIEPRVG